MSEAGRVADSTGNWVDTLAPAWTRPYLRLARADRPIGAWLLLMPCWWSAGLAAVGAGAPYPNPWHVVLFFVGAFVMRGAGCTWNDIVDRNLDAKVARTRSRPIPSGQVSVKAAAVFLALQALVGLLVLLQFNRFTVLLGIASLAIVGGLSGDEAHHLVAAGHARARVLVGRADGLGGAAGAARSAGLSCSTPGAICWVIGYDTIYAHQDREDDALIGVKSTARLFGTRTRTMLIVFYALAVVLIGLSGAAAEAGPVFVVGCIFFGAHLGWQIERLDIDDPELCLRLFKSNRDAGLILFAALIGDALYKWHYP